MKRIILIAFFTLLFCSMGFSQTKLALQFRVEKQAFSSPMSSLEDMFFGNSYYSKPVNVKFDGSILNMYYDNGASLAKKNVSEVNRHVDYEDGALILETILFTDNNCISDTISFIVDYYVGYVQVVLPTKNSKGEYIGYTSYRNFDKNLIKENSLAIN
jgi:hypothetical protein